MKEREKKKVDLNEKKLREKETKREKNKTRDFVIESKEEKKRERERACKNECIIIELKSRFR